MAGDLGSYFKLELRFIVNSAARGLRAGYPGRLYSPRPAGSIWCQAGGLSQEARAPMFLVSGALASLGMGGHKNREDGLGLRDSNTMKTTVLILDRDGILPRNPLYIPAIGCPCFENTPVEGLGLIGCKVFCG